MSTERSYHFDNIKFFLILLVMLGHAIEPLINQSTWLKSLYMSIYLFHMPAFIFVSGYFSKSLKLSRICRLILLYLLFNTLFLIFNHWIYQWPLTFNYVTPYWIMWFLMSMVFWQLLNPLFKRISYGLMVAIVLGIGVGYMDSIGYQFSLSRTLVFFPFFLGGSLISKERMQRIIAFSGRFKIVSRVLLITLPLIVMQTPLIHWLPGSLYGSFAYAKLGMTDWYAGFYRLFLYAVAFVLIIITFSAIPQQQTICSSMGTRTMYAYILHGFIIKWFVVSPYFNAFSGNYVLLLLATSLLCCVLTSPIVSVFKPLVELVNPFKSKP